MLALNVAAENICSSSSMLKRFGSRKCSFACCGVVCCAPFYCEVEGELDLMLPFGWAGEAPKNMLQFACWAELYDCWKEELLFPEVCCAEFFRLLMCWWSGSRMESASLAKLISYCY